MVDIVTKTAYFALATGVGERVGARGRGRAQRREQGSGDGE